MSERIPQNNAPAGETPDQKLERLFPNPSKRVGFVDSHGVLQTAESELEAAEMHQEDEREAA